MGLRKRDTRAVHRKRLVPNSGIECFEVRIVQWINHEGVSVTSAEISTPDGDDNANLPDVMWAVDEGKKIIRSLWKENDPS